MDSRQTEIKALQQYMQKSKEELQRLEQQLKEQKVSGGLSSPLPPWTPSPLPLPLFLVVSAQADLKFSVKLRMTLNL